MFLSGGGATFDTSREMERAALLVYLTLYCAASAVRIIYHLIIAIFNVTKLDLFSSVETFKCFKTLKL